jgi:hypothetical protein
MIKTIAQQLNIKEFPFVVKDKNGNEIYHENSSGDWSKREYDSKDNKTYFENSSGDWYKREYDSKDNKTYFEDSDGYWYKREYDSKGNQIYFEDSDGVIINNRPQSIPEYTMEQLTEMLGKEFKIKK